MPSPLPSFLPPDDTPPETVRARAEEWRKRLRDLQGRVEAWLPPGFTARIGPAVTLGAAPEIDPQGDLLQADTLLIQGGDAPLLILKPKGLWTVGAKARVDVLSSRTVHLLADISEDPEAPDWRVAGPLGPETPEPFDRAALLAILESAGEGQG